MALNISELDIDHILSGSDIEDLGLDAAASFLAEDDIDDEGYPVGRIASRHEAIGASVNRRSMRGYPGISPDSASTHIGYFEKDLFKDE